MSLWQKVLVGLVAGVIAGVVLGERAAVFQPMGTIFINLILMIVIPLIYFVLVNGVARLQAGENLTRLGIKSIVAFIGTATLAVVLGVLVTTIFKPGVGANLELVTDMAASAVIKNEHKVVDILLSIVPSNALKSMVEGNILHVILFAIFTGFTLNNLRETCPQLLKIVEEVANLMIKMVETIVKIAPFGVFGYMSWAIGTQGVEVLWSLSKLIVCIVGSCAIQYIIFGLIILVIGKISPWPFYRKIFGPQLLAFSTGSSKATMPSLMQVMQHKMGVSKNNTNFLIPLSSALNMDGGAIYLGSCVVFFAQATGMVLAPQDYLIIIFTCTLGSIGAAGIPSGILLFLGMALTSVGLPIEAVAIIAGIDRLLDMITTMINVTGDACLTLVIDKTENTLDLERYYQSDLVTSYTRSEPT